MYFPLQLVRVQNWNLRDTAALKGLSLSKKQCEMTKNNSWHQTPAAGAQTFFPQSRQESGCRQRLWELFDRTRDSVENKGDYCIKMVIQLSVNGILKQKEHKQQAACAACARFWSTLLEATPITESPGNKSCDWWFSKHSYPPQHVTATYLQHMMISGAVLWWDETFNACTVCMQTKLPEIQIRDQCADNSAPLASLDAANVKQ